MIIVNYDWDEIEDNIVEEYENAGNAIAEYTAEPGLFGNVVSQRRSGQDRFFHYDGSGSTIALTTTDGIPSDTCSYTAFGQVTQKTGNTEFPYTFIGRSGFYTDSETGICSVRRREYDPLFGLWLSLLCSDTPSSRVASFAQKRYTPLFVRASLMASAASLIVDVPGPYRPPPTPKTACASTGCDEEQGIITMFKEDKNDCLDKCKAEIVSNFEAVHRANMGPCCAGRNKCLQIANSTGDQKAANRVRCQNAWILWVQLNRKSFETLAAVKGCETATELADIACSLKTVIIRVTQGVNCVTNRPAGPLIPIYGTIPTDAQCCNIAKAEAALNCKYKNPNAQLLCCPFKDDGNYDVDCIEKLIEERQKVAGERQK